MRKRSAARDCHRAGGLERLRDHAVALGQLDELRDLRLVCVRLERHEQADGREPDRRFARHAERAAKVEVAFRVDADRSAMPIAVATTFSVTPAQPASACSSMSPEQEARRRRRWRGEGRTRRAARPGRHVTAEIAGQRAARVKRDERGTRFGRSAP